MRGFGNTHKIVLALVVGLVIGFGLGWLSFSDPETLNNMVDTDTVLDSSDIPDLGATGVAGDSVTIVEKELIEVKDQGAGSSVFVSRVALRNPGWVAIHEDSGGEPGTILGAKRFDGGTYQGIVTLLRGMSQGSMYHATLWTDDGDKSFDHEKDTLVRSSSGSIVSILFEAY